jgi:hypothetical protein
VKLKLGSTTDAATLPLVAIIDRLYVNRSLFPGMQSLGCRHSLATHSTQTGEELSAGAGYFLAHARGTLVLGSLDRDVCRLAARRLMKPSRFHRTPAFVVSLLLAQPAMITMPEREQSGKHRPLHKINRLCTCDNKRSM